MLGSITLSIGGSSATLAVTQLTMDAYYPLQLPYTYDSNSTSNPDQVLALIQSFQPNQNLLNFHYEQNVSSLESWVLR